MYQVLKNLFGQKSGNTLTSKVSVTGIGNKTINIIAADGAPFGFQPRIGWNVSPQAAGGQAVWLEWRTQLTALIGRSVEKQALIDWANEPHALSLKVIKAPGGVGKTRLAAEVTQSLLDTGQWSGGFAGIADFERAQRLAWQGQWILVVDYPEHSPPQLAKLIRAAKDGLKDAAEHKLRILLLCRAQPGIDSLLEQQGATSYASDTLLLTELAESDNLDLLNQSLEKLAPNAPSVSLADFQSWLKQSSLHKTALFVVALALHLSTKPRDSNRLLPATQLLQALLAREQNRWKKAEDGQGLPHGTLADVVAFATLFDGLPVADVNTQLGEVYAWSADTRQKIHAATAEVWPSLGSAKIYPPMAPDLLAAVFLWHWQEQPKKQGMVQDAQLLAMLFNRTNTGLTALLHRWHMHAYDQAVRLELGLPQEAPALASLLQSAAVLNLSFATDLKTGFTTQAAWPGLSGLSVFVGKPGDPVAAETETELELACRASNLNNHALNLAAAGDRPAALVAAQETVKLYRRLAEGNLAAYESDLAGSINNLASRLSDNGERPAGLVAANEAVELYRRQAQSNPAAYESDFAMSLNNQAIQLSESGDHLAALVAAKEAVELYRRLAESNHTAYAPNLAISINILANRLSDNGDRQAGLVAAKEAVELYRRLAVSNQAAYEPELAMSTHNLAIRLSDNGDRQAGLVAAKEAVDLYRRLAKSNPVAYEPDLAIIINNLAVRLSDNGDLPAALLAAKEAVDIRRRLAKGNPAVWEPVLAGSINNLANHLSESGNRHAGLVAANEAVDLYRRLAESNPAAYESNLAMSISNLANHLSECGDRLPALVAANEAVDLYRRLAESNRAAYEPDLAMSINNLANRLSESGDHLPALVAANEAVELYRRLAESNRAAYEPDLAMSIKNLANHLSESGDRPSALVAAKEAVLLFEKVDRQTRGAFNQQLESARRMLDRLL